MKVKDILGEMRIFIIISFQVSCHLNELQLLKILQDMQIFFISLVTEATNFFFICLCYQATTLNIYIYFLHLKLFLFEYIEKR